MTLVDKRIVIGKFDEGPLPEGFDVLYFCDHSLYRLSLVGGRDTNRRCAEFAAKRATPLCLHGETVVALRIEKIEPRHRRLAQIEALTAPIVYVAKFSARLR